MTRRSAGPWLATLALSLLLATVAWAATRPAAAAIDPQPDRQATEITSTGPFTAYIPLVRCSRWEPVPLVNGGFELDWSVESSHRALRVNTDGTIEEIERNEFLTPPGWLTWFKHGMPVEHDPSNDVGWTQPEVRQTTKTEPDRMRSGAQGQQLFSTWRLHDAGLLQQVNVEPGDVVRLSAWAHAWSFNGGVPDRELFAYWSEGGHVGYNHFFALEGTEGLDEADRNFTFLVGIDPYGGTDPFTDTVVWGQGAHIYNAYHQVPSVITAAQSPTITVFLRSRTLWRFSDNNAYWDDITLEVLKQ